MISSPLDPTSPLADEVRRTVDVLLSDAEMRLRLPGENGLDKAVHESRKRMKEVRSLLRMVRYSLRDADGQPTRAEANDELRSIGHTLGDAREAAVAVQTLDGLSLADAGGLRDVLKARHKGLVGLDLADAATDAATRLAGIRTAARSWQLSADGWSAMEGGIKRIYRDGRRAFGEALKSDGDAEAWHDWRKRAKDLRYVAELLRLAAPNLLGGLASLGKALTGALGDDHDLSELATKAREHGDEASAVAAEAQRSSKQMLAKELGERAYAEKPGAFIDRIGGYWTAATI